MEQETRDGTRLLYYRAEFAKGRYFLRILVDAARAADDAPTLRMAADWIARTGLEDAPLDVTWRASR